MGLSFDTNGKYLGWSNLFNYNSIEELNASEKLPMPKGIHYIEIQDIGKQRAKINQLLANAIEIGDEAEQKRYQLYIDQLANTVNIDEDINAIDQAKTETERISLYADLLNKINKKAYTDGKQQKVNITYTNPRGMDIVKMLQQHENTKLPKVLQQEVSKNFISSHIQNTVQDLVNMTRAYSPIEMELFRSASDISDKGNTSSQLTLLNPFCKYIMQYSNMVGKNVIGISANGEKGSFMWHYYLNDLIKHGTPKERTMGHFQFNTSRIIGRALSKKGLGELQQMSITGLPDLNMNGVDPNIQAEFESRITDNLYVDLMISQVLSAATDNAKELILAKVNAGSKLAKMYLFMITMGFNINDIVAFMTSPVANFIDKITEQDIFNNVSISLNDAINIAKGKFITPQGTILGKYIAKYGQLKMEIVKDLYLQLELGFITDPKITLDKKELDLQNKRKQAIQADIAEFENVLEGANEFSNFSQFLGMNQGIKTSKIDLQSFENKIKNMYFSRLKEYKGEFSEEQKALIDEIGDFNVKKWFQDIEYRKKVAEAYNIIKKCVNIFDAFTHIKQFDAIRKIYDAVCVVDNQSAIKATSFNNIISELGSQGKTYLSEKYQNNILKQIDNIIISKYIQEANIEIPIKKNWKYLQSDASFGTFVANGSFQLKDRASIATFKYLMESIIIPELKQGKITIIENDKITTKKLPELQENSFITSLKPTKEQNSYFYKCNLNMNTIKHSLDSQRKYQKIVGGLRDISSIGVTKNMSLADMFMLYNLIVNKNQYGSSRMTSLFDPIVSSNNKSIITKYLKWLGELDYSGKSRLNIENSSTTNNTLEINYQDVLRQAAMYVKSYSNLSDPYVILLNDKGVPELYMNTGGRGNYSKVHEWVTKNAGESKEQYIERVQNQARYFVLGGQYSDMVENQLKTIQELGDKTISYLNDFVRQGLLLIKKVCE